jgi:ABC-type lipoprotein release transport system permease subunit
VTIGVAVLAVGFAAALPPAWRATRIDPVAVLRRG